MPVNRATLSLIQKHEGMVLEAYPDPGYGWRIPTIGIGHTVNAGPPTVTKGMRITEAEALRILEDDLAGIEVQVREALRVTVNENQLGALISFAFNVGVGAFLGSTLLKKLNLGDYTGAAAEFPRWNKSNGKVLSGLTKRRAAEAELFSAPVNPSPSSKPEFGNPKPEFGNGSARALDKPKGRFVGLLLLTLSLLKKVFRR